MVPRDPLKKDEVEYIVQFLISLFLYSDYKGLIGLITIRSLSHILLKSLFYENLSQRKSFERVNSYNCITNRFFESIIMQRSDLSWSSLLKCWLRQFLVSFATSKIYISFKVILTTVVLILHFLNYYSYYKTLLLLK